ncbi:MAG TPA: hypothetical protein VGX76_08515 [Pirellulales bacterium]|nr:hypothetical protein [Pirellulales bacterium]
MNKITFSVARREGSANNLEAGARSKRTQTTTRATARMGNLVEQEFGAKKITVDFSPTVMQGRRRAKAPSG